MINPARTSPEAPSPREPGVCRWCGGKLRSLVEGEPANYCQNGCAPNDLAPFLEHCATCRRDFRTGQRGAIACHLCEEVERRELAAQMAADAQSHARYQFERFKRGGVRR